MGEHDDWASLGAVLDDLTDEQCARLLAVYRLGIAAGMALATAERPAPPQGFAVECDWEHGICLCPGCGAVIQVVNRQRRSPKVIDGDGREHVCQRQVAAVLQRHGVAGLEGILRQHAERAPVAHAPVVDAPTAPPPAPPPWERWR